MAFDIEPKNPEAGVYGMPNGFWPAFCVETPVKEVLGCEYTDHDTIKYLHDGYDGAWISEEEALEMHKLLKAFIETEEYAKHRYFSEKYNGEYFRRNQMEQMLAFLPICGGFRRAG